MSIAAPETEDEERHRALLDSGFDAGWENAFDVVEKAIQEWIDTGTRVGDLCEKLKVLRAQT